MKEIRFTLIKEITREYIRKGFPPVQAAQRAGADANLIMSRYNLGWDTELLTVGMDGFFKKLFKKIEKKIIRPIVHSKFFAPVISVIPVVGTAAAYAISAAQAARSIHLMRKSKQEAKRADIAFEEQAGVAYRQYQEETSRQNIKPMPFAEFKNYLLTQSAF